jgi:hypothetical protein
MMALYLGERIGIQPTMLTLTPIYQSESNRVYQRNQNSIDNLKISRTKNVISVKAQKKIRGAINWMLHAAKWKPVVKKATGSIFYFKINFCTLTVHSDYKHVPIEQLKDELLQPFLSYARQYFQLRNYIWRAERTDAGTGHFHFVGDTFISHWRLRKAWNRLLRKNGYLNYHKGDISKYEPNSVDIHGVNDVRNLGAEICKYMSKSDEQGKIIEGRLWGCNYELSRAVSTHVIADRDSKLYNMAIQLEQSMSHRFVEVKDKVSGKVMRIATLLFPCPRDWLDKGLLQLKSIYDNVIQSLQSGIDEVPIGAYEI